MKTRAAAFLALTLTMSACAVDGGNAATPTNTDAPSPTATPTPESSPIDIAATFAEEMRSLSEFRVDVSGELRAGGEVGEVTGEASVDGEDRHTQFRMTFADGTTTETEEMVVGGVEYTRDGTQWVRQPRDESGDQQNDPTSGAASLEGLLATVLVDRGSLDLDGYERSDGEWLHRLTMTTDPGITPDMLGIGADVGISSFSADVTFLAEGDGTPAGFILEGAWEQGAEAESSPTPVEVRIVFRFDAGATVRLEPPDDVWVLNTSEALGYKIRHPQTWVVERDTTDPERALDVYLAPVSDSVQVARLPVEEDLGAGLWFRGVADGLMAYRGAEPVVAADVVLGGELTARVFTLEVVEMGVPYFYQHAAVYGGGRAWDVVWYSDPGNETDDGKRFMEMLLTFEPLE